MNIKKIANSILNFTIKRLIEIFGIIISFIGIFLLISLFTYSPSDPNFIFNKDLEIQNVFGFQGSYISDLFLQSIGIISFLIPITYIITGINIFKKKEILLLIENSFYVVIYSIIGGIFFNFFYNESFELFINGNGGFVGSYFNQSLFKKIININQTIFYYSFIILIFLFFFLSINFKIKNSIMLIKSIINLIFRKTSKNYTKENEIIKEYIPQQEIKNLIQEDLPFIKAEQNQLLSKKKFLLPTNNLLKIPDKKERGNINKNENSNPEFLEKTKYQISEQ